MIILFRLTLFVDHYVKQFVLLVVELTNSEWSSMGKNAYLFN